MPMTRANRLYTSRYIWVTLASEPEFDERAYGHGPSPGYFLALLCRIDVQQPNMAQSLIVSHECQAKLASLCMHIMYSRDDTDHMSV